MEKLEKLEAMVRVSHYNKMPLGIIAMIINMVLGNLIILGYKVDYEKLKDVFKDIAKFNKFNTVKELMEYVVDDKIETKWIHVEDTSFYNYMLLNSKDYKDFLISIKEYNCFMEIYQAFIDTLIERVKDVSPLEMNFEKISQFHIVINLDKIKELYKDTLTCKEMYKRFIEAFCASVNYNAFFNIYVEFVFIEKQNIASINFKNMRNVKSA